MRIIPKKIKVRNTVWKCYSMTDIIVALITFALIFTFVTTGVWVMAVILGLLSVIMFMPTQDGIFYSLILENVRFVFAKKKYTAVSSDPKEKIDSLFPLKEIKDNGIIKYDGGIYARVIKLGQKNFLIEDEDKQDYDVDCFASALKILEVNQFADVVKIDRPVNLDVFSEGLFTRLKRARASEDYDETSNIRTALLRERLDKIDKLNNLKKRYVSDFYLVIYGRNEEDLENVSINVALRIGKSGISAKILGREESAVFLKYCFSRNFDERTVKSVEPEDLALWVKPREIEFRSQGYSIDGLDASVLAVADYPMRVKNAWGTGIFHIPNTKAVMRLKPVDKFKAIRRIDKCISDMEAKRITAENASETSSAEIHRDSMETLLESLQAENESLFDVTLTVTAYNYLNDDNYKKSVRRSMGIGNFKPSTLYGLQIEGFKASGISPTATLKNYERGINSSSLAAAFPFVMPVTMDDGGILLGENILNRYPFFLNIWKRTKLHQNSNGMVIGQSGSGKSFFMKNLIASEWSNGTRVILLDPEAEYLALTRNFMGNVIDVGSASEGRINPFHVYKILTEDGEEADPVTTFNTHLKTLESFFRIVLSGASSDVIELINNLAVKAYEIKGIEENTPFDKLKAEDFPLFDDLLKALNEEKAKETDPYTLRDMRTAETYLQKFVSGRYSDIWNAPSTLKTDGDIIDFNFQSLFANKNNVVANSQMLLVFRFIEQEVINAREKNRNGKNLHTLIIVDEGHLFIDAKYPIALDFFYSMSKRIRKYGGSFIPATQNIADWNANEELRSKTSAIIKNSQYNFIFKLSAPDMKDVIDVYKVGDGFNKDECDIITKADTGQAFFIGSAEERLGVKIIAGEFMRELFEDEKKEVKPSDKDE